MEGSGARGRTGKAALYRRWASKHDLVQAALHHAVPPLPEPRAGRSARENLLAVFTAHRSEEHTSELQSHLNLVCRLLLEKKKKKKNPKNTDVHKAHTS